MDLKETLLQFYNPRHSKARADTQIILKVRAHNEIAITIISSDAHFLIKIDTFVSAMQDFPTLTQRSI